MDDRTSTIPPGAASDRASPAPSPPPSPPSRSAVRAGRSGVMQAAPRDVLVAFLYAIVLLPAFMLAMVGGAVVLVMTAAVQAVIAGAVLML